MAFNNPEMAKQLINFDTLRFGDKGATDLDCFIDWEDRDFIFVEYKKAEDNAHVNIPWGQELALVRLARALNIGGMPVAVLVAIHTTPVGNEVDGGNSKVVRVYDPNKNWDGWEILDQPVTVRQWVKTRENWRF